MIVQYICVLSTINKLPYYECRQLIFENVLQGYPVSKTLAEREAWKFAKENNLNLVTVIPPLIAGPSLTPDVPGSIGLATCLLTGP